MSRDGCDGNEVAEAMRTAAALLGLFLFQMLPATEAPLIDAGDYLFVYARIVDCGPELQAIDFGQVDAEGVVVLFEDISIVAKGRPVHRVRNELVDELEKRTGHRSRTLELAHVPGSDEEYLAKRLVFFTFEMKQGCAPIVLPPEDLHPLPPGELDPRWNWEFKRIVHASHHQSVSAHAPGAGAG